MKYKILSLLTGAALMASASASAAENVLTEAQQQAILKGIGTSVSDITITKVKSGGVSATAPSAPPQTADGNMPPPMPEGQPGEGMPGGFHPPQEVTQGTAARNITENGRYENQVFGSTGDNENALRITGASVILSQIDVDKLAGATSNTEAGDFYGQNAALLATDGANVAIENSTVNSSAQNGNGIFSYGKGTSVQIKNTSITTRNDNSGGIQTTGGGTTNAENLAITTYGNSSAAIRSDRGGGTVIVNKGTYATFGYGSPAIYSTADITVKNATLRAAQSEAAVIEGKNRISLENCTLEGSMSDTRKMGENVIHEENVHNIMLYQSMSGDAENGLSTFSMTGGKLISHKGDVIYVTNTACTITLDHVSVTSDNPDYCLLRVAGNSASRGWGKAGSNGGKADVTLKKETLSGNIVADTVSMLRLSLTDHSVLTGIISITENAQNGTPTGSLDVTIDKDSVWNLTGDSTVTTLSNHGRINKNGHTLTVLK